MKVTPVTITMLPAKFSSFLSKLCQVFILCPFFARQQKLFKKLATAIGTGGSGANVRHEEVNLIVRLYTVVISHDLCTNE